jgi:hypothetical protein
MFALNPDNPNEDLVKYLNNPFIQSITHNGECFSIDGVIKRGIHKTIKKLYYPHYTVKKKKSFRRTKLQRKGSSTVKGINIDKHIFDLVKKPQKKKSMRNSSVNALLSYWDTLEHTLQAAQVPVYIQSLNCCTQADVITQDKNGQLFVWEIKSGFNARHSQGTLLHIKERVPNSEKNHWQIQRHYTTQGLLDFGLPIKGSQVINVYEEGKDKVIVKRKKNPTWCKQLK